MKENIIPMSESNKHTEFPEQLPWQNKVIETKKPHRLGRREFLGIAALSGAGILIAEGLRKFGIGVNREPPAPPISAEEARLISTQISPTPTPFQPEATQVPAQPTEVAQYQEGVFANIDYFDSTRPIHMAVLLDNDRTILVRPFRSIPYHLGAENRLDPNTCWAFYNLGGILQLEGHSGYYTPGSDDFTFTAWQLAIEEINPNSRRTHEQIDHVLLDEYLQRRYLTRQGGIDSLVTLAGAVRVPPRDIRESKQNFLNIAPWLAQKYPNHGFENVVSGNPRDFLIIKYCGRNVTLEELGESRELSGELEEQRQARFYFALQNQ